MIDINDTENQIKDAASTLNTVTYQIAELSRIKESLELKITELLGHQVEGSKSYICDKYKVTVTTGFNYCLDKEEFSVLASRIPKCFNPVRQKISYEIDKSIVKDAEKYASSDELTLLSKFIIKKPKKLHVKITAAN